MGVEPTNPFAILSPTHWKAVAERRRQEQEAEKHFTAMLAMYRVLVGDARYQAIQQELGQVLGDQLRRLVKAASTCATCAPYAERVKLLDEIVDLPRQQVWFGTEAEKLEREVTDAGT